MAGELAKKQVNAGQAIRLFHFRDQQGLEVDFLVPRQDGSVDLLEVKSTRTITSEMARPLVALKAAMGRHHHRAFILHPGADGPRSVAPGISAVGLKHYLGTTPP